MKNSSSSGLRKGFLLSISFLVLVIGVVTFVATRGQKIEEQKIVANIGADQDAAPAEVVTPPEPVVETPVETSVSTTQSEVTDHSVIVTESGATATFAPFTAQPPTVVPDTDFGKTVKR